MTTTTTIVTERRYISVGKERKLLAERIRQVLDRSHHKVFGEFHESGGDSGDCGVETAELTAYRVASGQAVVQLYTLIDDSTNGYAELISVILSGDAEALKPVLNLLEEHDFVNKYTSLRARPVGHKSYADYLDKFYGDEGENPFKRN